MYGVFMKDQKRAIVVLGQAHSGGLCRGDDIVIDLGLVPIEGILSEHSTVRGIDHPQAPEAFAHIDSIAWVGRIGDGLDVSRPRPLPEGGLVGSSTDQELRRSALKLGEANLIVLAGSRREGSGDIGPGAGG